MQIMRLNLLTVAITLFAAFSCAQHQERPWRMEPLASSGFCIRLADGRIVGYSDGTPFLADSMMPPQLRSALAHLKLLPDGERKKSQRYQAVSPICQAQWGQSSPYNQECPLDNEKQHCYTGCVATAMAQVMHHYKWPARGEGVGTYFDPLNGTTEYAFGAYNFQWELMLKKYNSTNTNVQQRAAVARLMLECGVAVDMQYTTFGSASYMYDIPYGMSTYLGYSRQIRYISRDCVTDDEWLQTIYDELTSGRPILFGAQNADGGHCFVADGIDEEGLLHINWGWDGRCNGYFDVDVLFPAEMVNSGYTTSQEIVVGITPRGQDEDVELQRPLMLRGGVTCRNLTPARNSSFTLQMDSVCNYWAQPFSGHCGFALCQDGELLEVLKSFDVSLDTHGRLDRKIQMVNIPASYPDGQYTIVPVFREGEGEWHPMTVPTLRTDTLYVELTANTIEMSSWSPQQVNSIESVPRSKFMVEHYNLGGRRMAGSSGKNIHVRVLKGNSTKKVTFY